MSLIGPIGSKIQGDGRGKSDEGKTKEGYGLATSSSAGTREQMLTWSYSENCSRSSWNLSTSTENQKQYKYSSGRMRDKEGVRKLRPKKDDAPSPPR